MAKIMVVVEEARDPIAETGAIPVILKLLSLARAQLQEKDQINDDLVIQCLRALANLCYDHGM